MNLECGVEGLSGFPIFLASTVASPGSLVVPALGILQISRVREVAGMSWSLP